MDKPRWYKVTITANVQEMNNELAVNTLLLYIETQHLGKVKPTMISTVHTVQGFAEDIMESSNLLQCQQGFMEDK